VFATWGKLFATSQKLFATWICLATRSTADTFPDLNHAAVKPSDASTQIRRLGASSSVEKNSTNHKFWTSDLQLNKQLATVAPHNNSWLHRVTNHFELFLIFSFHFLVFIIPLVYLFIYLFWFLIYLFKMSYKLVLTILGSYFDISSYLFWHFILFGQEDIQVVLAIIIHCSDYNNNLFWLFFWFVLTLYLFYV
jgi:hypothetical protein